MNKKFSVSGRALRAMWAATILALTFDLSLPVCVYSASDDERNIEAMATKRVQPAYPPMAQKYRIEGMVVVQVSVGGDGKVSKAEFVRGHNIFRSVSLDAAKRWEFRPPGSSGMSGTVRFVFKLSS